MARLFFIVARLMSAKCCLGCVRERLISPTNIYSNAGRCVRCACADGWAPPSLFVCVSLSQSGPGGGMKTERLPVTLAQKNW